MLLPLAIALLLWYYLTTIHRRSQEKSKGSEQKMKKANQEIRAELKTLGVPYWAVADKLGLSDSTFSRKLRHELPDSEKQRILTIITQLAEEA